MLLSVLVITLLLIHIEGKPQALILKTTNKSPNLVPQPQLENAGSGPIISKLHVTSEIQFRYSQTQVVSYVKNPSSKAEEISFTAVIPDSAFISNFSMVMEGKEYVAEVKAKEEAKKEYQEAVTDGRGAGLVSQDARDANTFTVATNVEAGQKVEFKLMYEELLERKLGKYQHVININPGQIVEDLRIQVFINESLPIKSLDVPELKESNDIDFEENQESKIAKVERYVDGDASKAQVTFAPDRVYQEEAGEQGLSGQFLVQYDVDRNGQDNEIQVIDGYFVHYFTPEDLPTLPKHVIFVLDTSGSMSGEKMNQLKDAMFTILDDMTERDFFNIVTFSSRVSQWNPILGANNQDGYFDYSDTTPAPIKEEQFVIEATDKNKKEAIDYIISLSSDGGTNINAGLLEGLKFATFAKQNEKLPKDLQSIIVFLSDGQATEGVTTLNEIKENVKKANTLNVPIYSLGFGRDADFNLIQDISSNADAFSKQIYEGSDAAIQLENFFAEISSPLLSNLKFQYVGGLVDNSSVSQPKVRTFFKGGEFVVAGKLLDLPQNDNQVLDIIVTGDGEKGEEFLRKLQICLWHGPIIDSFHPNDSFPISPLDDIPPFSCTPPPPPPPSRSQAQNFLQKLHAFLNIKQLLKKNDEVNDDLDRESAKEKALRLALENNFVTELTSLVVIRPDEEPKINTLVTEEPDFYDYSYGGGSGYTIAYSGYRTTIAYSGYSRPAYTQYKPYSRPAAAIVPMSFVSPSTYDYAYDVAYDSFDDNYDRADVDYDVPATTTEMYYDEPATTTEMEEEPTNCSGNITLFSKTYLRGENVTFSEDTVDLAHFDNKLVSIAVEGDCSWDVFTEVGFGGISQRFGKGKYISLVQVGGVFRKASSLLKVDGGGAPQKASDIEVTKEIGASSQKPPEFTNGFGANIGLSKGTTQVKDENDHAPFFTNIESGKVLEHLPPGLVVMQVSAIDNDETYPNNRVIYSISDEDQEILDKFSINPDTGVITTKVEFNREEKSVYEVTIIAKDGAASWLLKNGEENATSQKFRIDVVELF